jgi:hypothetical protein
MTTTQAAPAQNGIMTSDQLVGMTPEERRAYLASVGPADQAAAQAAVAAARQTANSLYLRRCEPSIAICPPSGGGIQATYANGQTLVFNLPTAEGAFIKSLLIYVSLNVTLAAGTGATYGKTANAAICGAAAGIDTIEVYYNGTQAKLRPMLAVIMDRLRGYSRAESASVLAGASDTTIGGYLNAMNTTAGTQTWTFLLRVPLNALHPYDPAGMLPSMGAVTPGFVKVNTSQNLLGPDPILNAVYASGGTGNAITVNSTSYVKVEAEFVDGTNLQSTSPLTLDLAGEPTVQYIIDQTLQPLAAGSIQRQRIMVKQKHYAVISVVVDGLQANQFATVGNIAGLELDKDSVGQNKFFAVGQGTNQSIYDFYERLRYQIGADLPVEGIVPWVVAPVYGSANPSNREGLRVLNMTPGGWVDACHAYYLTSVGTGTNGNPRVETYLISLNDEPLVK